MPSRAEAEKNGEMVTHEGACGTCSTFKDLSVYMSNPNLGKNNGGFSRMVIGTIICSQSYALRVL